MENMKKRRPERKHSRDECQIKFNGRDALFTAQLALRSKGISFRVAGLNLYVQPSQEKLALAALNDANVIPVSPIIESVEVDNQDEDYDEFIPDLTFKNIGLVVEVIMLIDKQNTFKANTWSLINF